MNRKEKRSTKFSVMKPFFIILLFACLGSSPAEAVSTLNLSWQDNSTDETGFNIERATSSAGPFTKIATLGANVTTYSDANLAEATTFCYRTNAFNAAGSSPYTNVVCGMTKATLALSKTGTGSGRISSQPTGLDCNVSCTIQFNGNSSVTLIATAATGSVFRGWSGGCTGTASTCTVTMNRPISVTANFDVLLQSGNGSNSGTDYDGDGKRDVTVYRDGGWFIVKSSDGTLISMHLGGGSQVLPVPGDYDGDGIMDGAVYEMTNGRWLVVGSSAGEFTAADNFGGPGFIPVVGDYDGDGVTDVGVYERTTGNWYALLSTEGFAQRLNFGGSNYIPVPGDYDGDGTTDLAVYDKSKGHWFIDQSTAGFRIHPNFGGTGFLPVSGDYDGDGKTDTAVYQSSTGHWFAAGSTTGFLQHLNFGGSGFMPIAGDYDGDGITDTAVYQASTGNWFIAQSTAGFRIHANFGGDSYVPVFPEITILRALGLL